ncbi:hypothetical protein LTR37_004388 [Vermiconidia calcicola]|uniref:Uncharacterized protein n=1 Tax=Vermiconidia calcicola TaxID=1690605 RepID=A0ACC3NMS3_9PEZI|nr:hypothetical protein LTR37_004388 [Vermiconidia calcicola]
MASPALDKPPYTLHNLPYGVISTNAERSPRCAVAIGDMVLDLVKYAKAGKLTSLESGHNFSFEKIFAEPALNTFASLPWPTRRTVREQIQSDLQSGSVPSSCFEALKDVENHLPMKIGGYSDFYTSLEHCQNCSAFMSAAAIPKNWFYTPSVYNSRASSVIPTSRDIRRPKNVYFSGGIDSEPTYGPTRKMDYELEMGYFVSSPIPLGERMPIEQAKEHIFGFVLLNDWSARDHQLFEMRPLGPFHSKGFGTTISNWIVPMEALEPFSCAPNTKQDPPPFEHLTWPEPKEGALDVKLRIKLVRDGKGTILGKSNLKYMYWTPYQQLTHHAQSGCGTISGSGVNQNGEKAELGCLYEAAQTKTNVLPKGSGEYEEGYLEDGDEIILEGWCEDGQGNVAIGFGECRGRIVPPYR